MLFSLKQEAPASVGGGTFTGAHVPVHDRRRVCNRYDYVGIDCRLFCYVILNRSDYNTYNYTPFSLRAAFYREYGVFFLRICYEDRQTIHALYRAH